MPVTRYRLLSSSTSASNFGIPATTQSAVWPSGTQISAANITEEYGLLIDASQQTTGSFYAGSSGAVTTLAQTGRQSAYLGAMTTRPLAAQTIAAGTWTFALFASESNGAANAFFGLSIYVWRPSTSSVVGRIYDSTAELGAEFPSANSGRVFSVSGSSVTAQDGDRVIIEIWYTAAQAMATSYNIGTACLRSVTSADIVADGDTGSGWVDFPDELPTLPLRADTRSYTLTGNDATLTKTSSGPTLTADTVSFTLTGIAANLLDNARLAADPASFALTGIDANLEFGRLVTADPVAFVLTGQDVTFAATRRLTADVAAFTLTGIDAGLLASRRLTADQVAYALTGYDIAFAKGFSFLANAGVFALAGQDAGLLATRRLAADVVAYTWTGIDAGVRAARRLTSDQATFTLTGIDIALALGKSIGAGVGTFTWTGQAAGLVSARRATAETGALILTGRDAGLIFARKVSADTVAFTLLGYDALFFRGRLLSEFVCPVVTVGDAGPTVALVQTFPATPGLAVTSTGGVISLQQSITDPVSPTVAVDQSVGATLTIRSQC